MSILRIITSPAELTTLGGTYNTSDTTKYDSTRTRGVFKHSDLQISSLTFPEAAGTTTWIHFAHSLYYASPDHRSEWSNSILEVYDASSKRMALIEIVPTFQWTAKVDDGSSTVTATQQVLGDSLFKVDIKIVVGATVDIEVYFNSALQGTASITNTQSAGNPARINFGVFDSDTDFLNNGKGYTWFGEFIIADEDTRGFNLRELTPQSFGVFQQWDGTVASVTDDSLATGVSTDVADERVSFGLANLDAVDAGDIINRVVVQSYAQRGASGLTAMNHFFRYDDTTVQDGGDISLGLTGDWYVDEYANNPKTATSWAPADLAGIQIGARARA